MWSLLANNITLVSVWSDSCSQMAAFSCLPLSFIQFENGIHSESLVLSSIVSYCETRRKESDKDLTRNLKWENSVHVQLTGVL